MPPTYDAEERLILKYLLEEEGRKKKKFTEHLKWRQKYELVKIKEGSNYGFEKELTWHIGPFGEKFRYKTTAFIKDIDPFDDKEQPIWWYNDCNDKLKEQAFTVEGHPAFGISHSREDF